MPMVFLRKKFIGVAAVALALTFTGCFDDNDSSADASSVTENDVSDVSGHDDDSSANEDTVVVGTLTDSRDGATYKTVKIKNQVWMAENLNFSYKDDEESWCFNRIDSNCVSYGRLYSWDAAQKVCPEGWRLPSSTEFETLAKNVGGLGVAGDALKSRTGWGDDMGRDLFGFNALLAGMYAPNAFGFTQDRAVFWSSTERDELHAYYLALDKYFDAEIEFVNKINGHSVRCLED